MLESILPLLIHPETEFQRQGLMLLESLDDEEVWTQLMRYVRLKSDTTVAQSEDTKGLTQAFLSNPFYDYSRLEELQLTRPYLFDLEEIQPKNLKKLKVHLDLLSIKKAHLNQIPEEDVFYLQGLRRLSSITSLELVWEGYSFFLSEKLLSNMENITSLNIYKRNEWGRPRINIDFMEKLPNLRELHLLNMEVASAQIKKYPAKIYVRENLNVHANFDVFGKLLLRHQHDLERLHFFSENEQDKSRKARGSFLNFRALSGFKVREIIFETPYKIVFEEVFGLLERDEIPRIQISENCSWGFEQLISLKELFSDPEQVIMKLSAVHRKIEEQGALIISISLEGEFWKRKNDHPALQELHFLGIKEVHLQLLSSRATPLGKYDVQNIPQTITKLVIVSGVWNPEKKKWDYEGCSPSQITDFSGLEAIPFIEEIELHNFEQIKPHSLKKYFSQLPELKQLRLVKCNVDIESLEEVRQKYLSKIKLVVNNNL